MEMLSTPQTSRGAHVSFEDKYQRTLKSKNTFCYTDILLFYFPLADQLPRLASLTMGYCKCPTNKEGITSSRHLWRRIGKNKSKLSRSQYSLNQPAYQSIHRGTAIRSRGRHYWVFWWQALNHTERSFPQGAYVCTGKADNQWTQKNHDYTSDTKSQEDNQVGC